MAQTSVEMAKDLTLTLIEAGRLSPEDTPETLQRTHATLTALKAQEETGSTLAVPASVTSPGDWQKSITRHAVTCLECGRTFKQLSRRHLQEHGLDNQSYRAKYGIPRTEPLAAKTTTTRRRQVVQAIRPWEKAPRFVQAHEHNGHATPEPEAGALSDQAEAPAAAASAQPKRQRTSTPKKETTRKKSAKG